MAWWVAAKLCRMSVCANVLLSTGRDPLLRLTSLPSVLPMVSADILLFLPAMAPPSKKRPMGRTLKVARMHPLPSICETAETLRFARVVTLLRCTGPSNVLLFARKQLPR